jgi:hypothetical protein
VTIFGRARGVKADIGGVRSASPQNKQIPAGLSMVFSLASRTGPQVGKNCMQPVAHGCFVRMRHTEAYWTGLSTAR